MPSESGACERSQPAARIPAAAADRQGRRRCWQPASRRSQGCEPLGRCHCWSSAWAPAHTGGCTAAAGAPRPRTCTAAPHDPRGAEIRLSAGRARAPQCVRALAVRELALQQRHARRQRGHAARVRRRVPPVRRGHVRRVGRRRRRQRLDLGLRRGVAGRRRRRRRAARPRGGRRALLHRQSLLAPC